ncbi:acyltransferase family protein [Aquipuribacter sp. SD81]|uniref:acyltransferase family protein n=1 Tax=Aquipuribacter sp. SD81 TaxID=3127703 RepID=UPI0030194446
MAGGLDRDAGCDRPGSSGARRRLTRAALAVDAATPTSRDRYLDLLRLVSLVVVVLAHWALVLVVLDGTQDLARSPLAVASTWLLMVMPLFFAVGGATHARTLSRADRPPYARFVLARAERLLGPVVALLGVWAAASALASGAVALGVVGSLPAPVALAVDNVSTPLWFVGVYLLVVVLAPAMHALHRRHRVATLLALVAAVVAVDAVRFGWLAGDGVPVAGLADLVLVWLTIHQLGFVWYDRTALPAIRPDGSRPRPTGSVRVGLVLLLLGWGTAGVLAATGAYPADMQGLPGNEDVAGNNFLPPTAALLAHGVGLLGLALVLRPVLTRVLRVPVVWLTVVSGSRVLMTLFCWHLTAAYLVVGVLLLTGLALPAAGSVAWWWLLLGVEVACAAVLAGLVALARRGEDWALLGAARSTVGGRRAALVAVAAATTTAVGVYLVSQVGLDGWLDGTPEALRAAPGLSVSSTVGVVVLGLGVLGLRALAGSTSRPQPPARSVSASRSTST